MAGEIGEGALGDGETGEVEGTACQDLANVLDRGIGDCAGLSVRGPGIGGRPAPATTRDTMLRCVWNNCATSRLIAWGSMKSRP